MSYRDAQARRRAQERARRARARRRLTVLTAVVAVVGLVVALTSGGPPRARAGVRAIASRGRADHRPHPSGGLRAVATGLPGHATVPILMYHVINPPIRRAPYPGLYVSRPEFAAQMQALKKAGWHAITLNQLGANWSRGLSLGPGRPIVLTFDNGYQSQYTNALPVLRRLGWVGVENLQLSGLPPSQGGLSTSQIRGLLSAGWELDTQGMSHADLVTLGAAQLRYQVDVARELLRRRYGVPVNWFAYPSGHYDPAVISAVRAAGFEGSTTVVSGWASRLDDPYRLPRLRVLGGTTAAELLSQIAATDHSPLPPPTYS